MDRRQLRLARGSNVNEDRDEDQQRVAEQAEEAEQEGEPWPTEAAMRVARRRPSFIARSARAPAAVHRKSQDQVENGEDR